MSLSNYRFYRDTFPNIKLKYPDLATFNTEYESKFLVEEEAEQMRLLETANWMAVMLSKITAKLNKVWYLNVVAKFLEGYAVKYTLGTGQYIPS
jgi:hypothetical protein